MHAAETVSRGVKYTICILKVKAKAPVWSFKLMLVVV